MINSLRDACLKIDELREALAASQRREEKLQDDLNREGERLNEFMARLAAAAALVGKWREFEASDPNSDGETTAEGVFQECATELERALTPPPAHVSGESNG